MKQGKLACLLILLLPLMGSAQSVPGYLGKRLGIYYQGYLSPSFQNPNSGEVQFQYPNDPSGNQTTKVGFSMNYQHHVTLEYVLGKRWSILGDLVYSGSYVDPTGGGWYEDNYSFREYAKVNAVGFNVAMRKYRKHYAPLGPFAEYRLGYANVSTGDFTYYETSGATGEVESKITGGSEGNVMLGIAFGTNRVVNDKFVITYSFEISYFLSGWKYVPTLVGDTGYQDLDPREGDSVYNQELLIKSGASRFAIESFINLRLGVGLLP